VTILAGDLDEILEALVGQKDGVGAASLEEGVSGDRGPMKQERVGSGTADMTGAGSHCITLIRS